MLKVLQILLKLIIKIYLKNKNSGIKEDLKALNKLDISCSN